MTSSLYRFELGEMHFFSAALLIGLIVVTVIVQIDLIRIAQDPAEHKKRSTWGS